MTTATRGDGRSSGCVLVTGACGFIGAHVVRQLLGQNFGVVALDDLSTGDAAALPVSDRLRLVVGSVTDDAVVRRAAAGCCAAIHLAGLVGMELVRDRPERTYEVSVRGTEALLRATPHVPVILLSSSCIYGTEHDGRCVETEPIPRERALAFDAGTAAYATGKWEMERMARRALRDGRDVMIVRPFNVVGPGQSMRYGMVLPRFVHAALRGEAITVYGTGAQRRSFSCVMTFAAALVRLLVVRRIWRTCDHLINLGDTRSTSILELVRVVLAETGSRSRLEYVPYASRYPGRSDVLARRPDTTRAHELLGPLPWPDLRTIVRRIVAASSDGRVPAGVELCR